MYTYRQGVNTFLKPKEVTLKISPLIERQKEINYGNMNAPFMRLFYNTSYVFEFIESIIRFGSLESRFNFDFSFCEARDAFVSI